MGTRIVEAESSERHAVDDTRGAMSGCAETLEACFAARRSPSWTCGREERALPASRVLAGDVFFSEMIAPIRDDTIRSESRPVERFVEALADRLAPGGPAFLLDLARLEVELCSIGGFDDPADADGVTRAGVETPADGKDQRPSASPEPFRRIFASRFPVVTLWAEATDRARPGPIDLSKAEAAILVHAPPRVRIFMLPTRLARLLLAMADGSAHREAPAAGGAIFEYAPVLALTRWLAAAPDLDPELLGARFDPELLARGRERSAPGTAAEADDGAARSTPNDYVKRRRF